MTSLHAAKETFAFEDATAMKRACVSTSRQKKKASESKIIVCDKELRMHIVT